MRSLSFWAALAALSGIAGCSKKPDVVVAAADSVVVTDADVDRDPVALLPGGAVAIVHVDAPQLFQSEFGQKLAQLAAARVPIPQSAGFDPTRDLQALYVGVYSMQGADVAGVATGTFNPDAIEKAADGTTLTPLGAPLVKTTYSRRTLYVSRNVGFSVLTAHTVLFGDETGIRRALDRLSEGVAKHDVASWVDDLLRTPNAATVAAVDLVGQPPIDALSQNLPFLRGVQTARVVGNFQAPGMNFAGSLTYPDPQTAQTAAAAINQTSQTIGAYSIFLQLAGIGNPFQSLQATAAGNDAQFVAAVQSKAITWALGLLADRLAAPPTPATPIPVQGNR